VKRVGDGMRQIRWLDHVREVIAVWLAPWAVYPDVREYHRGESNQESKP
jgi:hypothetical protein